MKLTIFLFIHLSFFSFASALEYYDCEKLKQKSTWSFQAPPEENTYAHSSIVGNAEIEIKDKDFIEKFPFMSFSISFNSFAEYSVVDNEEAVAKNGQFILDEDFTFSFHGGTHGFFYAHEIKVLAFSLPNVVDCSFEFNPAIVFVENEKENIDMEGPVISDAKMLQTEENSVLWVRLKDKSRVATYSPTTPSPPVSHFELRNIATSDRASCYTNSLRHSADNDWYMVDLNIASSNPSAEKRNFPAGEYELTIFNRFDAYGNFSFLVEPAIKLGQLSAFSCY